MSARPAILASLRLRNELLFVTGTVAALLLSMLSGWSQTPIITEFMAWNTSTLDDENGDSSDWIEIYNPAPVSWNLNGWHLTDNVVNLTKWRFPSVTLNPGEFLIVFASGKNRTNTAGRLHTSFGLADSGDYLALIQPDGITIAIQFAPLFPSQLRDVSYGSLMLGNLVQPGPPTLLFPTPGRANPAIDYASSPPPVEFSRAGGTFSQPFHLTLSSPTASTTIRYEIVINGQSEAQATNYPTLNSPAYSTPLWIDRPVQVRTRAYSSIPGTSPGAVRTETYLPITTNLTTFTSTLPLLVIHTLGPRFIDTSIDSSVSVAFFEPESGVASLVRRPSLIKRAGLSINNSATLGAPKATYALELWDEFNQGEKVPVLGMPAESDWVLYGPYNFDRNYLQNPLPYELSRSLGRYASRTRFVEVFLNTSSNAITFPNPTNPIPANAGSYLGVFVVQEKVKRDSQRVNIDRLTPTQITEPDLTGGYLLKIDRTDPGDRLVSTAQGVLILQEPNGAMPSAQPDYLRNYFARLDASLLSQGYTNFTGTNHYSHYLDLDAAIDHHLINVLCMNVDALRLNTYLSKPRLGRITMGPVWDFDRALTSTDGRSFNPRNWRPAIADLGTDYFNTTLSPGWGRLFGDTDFFQRWIDRYQELRAHQWHTNELARLIDQLADQVRAAQPRDAVRWGFLPRTGTFTAGSYSHTFPGTYQGEVDFLKRWVFDRMSFMDTQFLARPILISELISSGDTLRTGISASHPSGLVGTQIYFTLDGSDPRSSQNLTNVAAQPYTGPFILETSARVVARAFNRIGFGGNLSGSNNPPLKSFWSGPSQISVTGRPPSLRITEVMYHPAEEAPDSAYGSEDYQFVELKNIGPAPVRLGGIWFTNGVEFTFPSTNLNPGAYAVVVKSRIAFAQRYGNNRPVLGEFSGALDFGGERLTLVDVAGQLILDFEYSDRWQGLTDGPGLSLVAANESAAPEDFSLRRGWRASRLIHGSPGAGEPDTIPFIPVVINELLSNPLPPYEDAVELYNPTGVEADISHWYLTDDFNEPRKFHIPSGTLVPAFGFQAFDEHAFNPFSGVLLPTSFSFNASGDAAYLFSANAAGDLTGYVHGFRFGAALTNVTFGRQFDADGLELFVAQSEITFAQSNSAPRSPSVGQRPTLALTEIMHAPGPVPSGSTNTPGDMEFIEIKNIGPDSLDLTDAEFVAGIDFTFPNVQLAPGQYALIVKNQPAFASLYGTNRPVIGEFSGGLASEGERLTLLGSAGEPVFDFSYDPAPFPLAVGLGFSMVLADEHSPRDTYATSTTWRTGSIEGGTPGEAELPPSWSSILINEILFTGSPSFDFGLHEIELFNPTTNSVDVGGWFFTHNIAEQVRVPIPEPTVIPPGGYQVISNAALLMDVTDSGLYSHVWLVSAEPGGGRRTGYVTGVEIGPVVPGDSFGPHVTSTGRQDVVPLAIPTLGDPNSGPRVGPIVISEVQYHPRDVAAGTSSFDNARDEFIELLNLSDSPLLLDGWSLAGDIQFPFPPGSILPGNGAILIVGFDPADVAESNRFATVHFLASGTTLHGPWEGGLKNSSGDLELMHHLGGRNWTRVDRLRYSDNFPWPRNADGTGASLQRITPQSYGDDPANWRAALPSAGRPNSGGTPPVIVTQPADTSGIVGGEASFEITATSETPLSYQWFHDGQSIPNATDPTLRLQDLQFQDAGQYGAVVFSSGGVVASTAALLIVRAGPSITSHPTNVALFIAPDPAAAAIPNATFHIEAVSFSPPLTYQWRFNGVSIPGATGDSLLIPSVSIADEGDYTCAVTDTVGTLVSAPARLSPLISPQFIQPPLSQRVLTGATVTVSVTVSGNPFPFSFEWRRSATPLLTNTLSRTTDFWTFTAPTNVVSNFLYRVVVKNPARPAPGISAPFFITTLIDSDSDGLPDEFETAHGLDPANASDAALDSDGDQMSNAAEYLAGTEPLNPLSYLRIEPPAGFPSSTGPEISFLAMSNRTYTVEARPAVDHGPWAHIAEAVASPSNRVVTLTDPLPGGTNVQRVYRLATPRQPGP